MTDRDEEYGSLWFALAAGSLLLAGALLRFRALGTSLFEDEVWVAELLRHGGWRPHSYLTPPLFYAVMRGWTSLRGFSDVALREPAAIFGIALSAVPLLAPRSRLTRLVWLALLAFSSPLLFYSTRLKQYTLEALVAALLTVLLLRAVERESRGAVVVFFLLAALAVTTLYSTVFPLAAMALLCVRRPRLLAGFAAIFLLFGVAYLGWLSPGPESTRLHGDMQRFFAERGWWADSPAIFLAATRQWLGQAMNLVTLWWLFTGIVAALWLFEKRDVAVAVLAAVPPAIVATASALHLYPYGEVRLMIVLFPALYLFVASAVAEASRRIPLLLLALIPFAYNGGVRDVYNATYMHVYDLRGIYRLVAESHRGEPVFAEPGYLLPFRYYAPQLTPHLVPGTIDIPHGSGWYLQSAPRFSPAGARVIARDHECIAAWVP